MSCDDDVPAPSPSAAVLARRARREAKSMREESKVCRRASRQRRERELTAERIQKYIFTLYRETNKAGEPAAARAGGRALCLFITHLPLRSAEGGAHFWGSQWETSGRCRHMVGYNESYKKSCMRASAALKAMARLFASAWDRRYVRSFRAGAAVRLI